MKKLLFSAVALIAFSSVSMGNTIAVEKTILDNAETIEVVLAVPDPAAVESGCADYAALTIANCGICSDLSDKSYFQLYRGLVDTCIASVNSIVNMF